MKKLILILVCIGLLSLPVSLMASTSADKQAAIDAGLAYLAATQQANGSWSYGGYEPAATAAVLLSFVDQSYKPLGWNGQNYSAVVAKAAQYLLSDAQTYSFAAGGNWWGFGAGSSGIQMAAAGGENTYTTGLTIPALSRLVSNPYGGAPLVNPGAIISGTGNSLVDGKTYAFVIQKMVDSFTYGQTGPAATTGNRFGGWRYFPGQNDSDMSTTQWGPISYLFAAQVSGVTIPAPGGTTRVALQAWLTADQVSSGTNKGAVDYLPGTGWYGDTHSGGFLVSNYFAGGGGSVADALTWLNAHWPGIVANPGWGVGANNEGNPYAMWAVYKGLETIYGTTALGPISNLNPETTAIDAGAIWNWWEDYCQYLVLTQNHTLNPLTNGSWSGADYWTGPLATAWDINILNATATIIPPPPGGEVPEPATMILLGSGLVGLAGYVRKRMKK